MNRLILRRRYSSRFRFVLKIIHVCDLHCVYFSLQVDLHTSLDCRVTYKGLSVRTVQGEITVKTLTSASIR